MVKSILFALTNDYTHYCLSYAFQKQYDCKMYAISEVTSRPKKFFQKQKLVNFEKIWFLHDNIEKKSSPPDMKYLQEFENKYKINLWKLVQNERIFLYFKDFYRFSPNEILNILEQECRFYEKVLDEIKPNVLFTRTSSLHHQELLYQMCKNIGIKIIAMNYTLLGTKCMLSEEHEKLDNVSNLENINFENRSFVELQNHLNSFDLIKQLDQTLIKPGNSTLEKISSMKEYLLKFDSDNIDTHYTYYGRTKTKVLSHYLKDFFKVRSRQSFMDKTLKQSTDFNYHFVYYPLHTEIERSTLIGAPYYVNQIEVIKNIAKSLPINFKLVVKEHPVQINRSWRSKSDYEEIMSIPNVILYHPNFPKDVLYKNCSIVFTIAGTAGFEAACYGKPSITLVDLNYSILPSVFTLTNFTDLHELINKLLLLKVSTDDVNKFLAIFEKNVSNFDWSRFSKKLSDEFFSGSIQDSEINEQQMKSFLEKNLNELISFANEHVAKIT